MSTLERLILEGLGDKLNFSTTVFESQGRFADYFNRYAESIKPAGGNPAIIPGMGIAKTLKILMTFSFGGG
jgi:hypothetical protein